MTRVRLFVCVAVCALIGTGWLVGQDDKKDPPGKARGQLPAGWKNLGLDKFAIQKVYTIQTDYRGKIDTLNQQIIKLKDQEKAELIKVLTPAQRQRLKEIIAGKIPDDESKDKKPKD